MPKEIYTTKRPKHNLFIRTFIYSLLIIFISLLCYFKDIPVISTLIHEAEHKSYDLLFITRHSLNLNPKPPKDIVIIGIDATSMKKVGVPWPWPRQFHASLVDGLKEAKAKLIAFDIIFDTISPLSLQTQDIQGSKTVGQSSFDEGLVDDSIFAMSIKNAMNILLATEAEPLSKKQYEAILPIPPFLKAINKDASLLGNTSVSYDSDNFIRKARLIYPEFAGNPALSSSLALRTIQKYLNKQAQVLENNKIKLNEKILPDQFLINFYGPSGTIETIPYWKALELIYSNENNFFKDKIVLVGRSKLKASIDPFKSVRAPDTFPTPFSAITPNFSGIEIQATIIGNILDNNFITKASANITMILFIFISIITSLLVGKFRARLVSCFYLCLLLSLVYLILNFLLFIFGRLYIPVTYPIYGIIIPIYFINFLDQYFFVDSARRRQAKIFRQMVPPQIADEIEQMDQEELALGGTKRTVTILFADIKNFTGICEKESPDIVVNILNKFFTHMVNTIHKYNGLVDKFIGDAIMALWGSPKIIDKDEQVSLALNCAVAMKSELKELNEFWKRMGFAQNLSLRIGINTDEVVTGNVGSPDRMQFSAIGDGVNVASRLEAVNKIYGTDITLSEQTIKCLNNNDFITRELDTVIVPGKDTPIKIYELITNGGSTKELLEYYSKALSEYRKGDFKEAIKLWEKCKETNQNDAPSKVMLKRTIQLNEARELGILKSDWKPIWVIENK